MAVDWLKIKNDYINGGGSYRKLAEKYSVPFGSLRGRAEKEKWAEQKKTHLHNISTKTAQKAQKKISDALSDDAASRARIKAMATKMIEGWMEKHHADTEDTNDIRRMIQNCVDMGIFSDADSDKQGGVVIVDDIPH